MPINPSIPLQGRTGQIQVPDFAGIAQRRQQGERQNRLLDLQTQRAEQEQARFDAEEPLRKFQLASARDQARTTSLVKGAVQLQPMLEAGDFEGAAAFLANRATNLEDLGIDNSDTLAMRDLMLSDPDAAKAQVAGAVTIGEKLGILKTPPARASKLLTPEEEAQKIRINAERERAATQSVVARGVAIEKEKIALQEGTPRAQADARKAVALADKAEADAIAKEREVEEKEKRGQGVASDALAIIGSLLTPENQRIIGRAAGKLNSLTPTLRQSTRDVELALENLTNLLTIENLDLLTGVLSDTDIGLLRSLGAGALNLEGSPERVISGLQTIRDKLTGAGLSSPSATPSALPQGSVDATPLPAVGEQRGRFTVREVQ